MEKFTLPVFLAAMCVIPTSLLAGGDPVLGETKAFDCETCHSPNNLQMNPSWPGLAGQDAEYLAKQIRDYQAGHRKNGVMEQMVGKLSDEDVSDIAQFYADRKVTTSEKSGVTNSAGKKIYENGVVSRGIASCVECHGKDGRSGVAGGNVLLAGQQKRYLENQLYAFKYGDRANDVNGIMQQAVKQLSDSEIESISEYISGL